MPRRSERLRTNGYYDINGQPVISYRETPVNLPVNGEVTFGERGFSFENDTNNQENHMMFYCYVVHWVFSVCVALALICLIISLHSRPSDFGVKPTLTDTVTISGSKDQEYLSKLQLMESKLDSLQAQANPWPNFALESQGALILYKTTSKPYQSHRACRWLGVPVRLPPVDPNVVIKGRTHMYPGQCWAFADFPGRLSIALSHKATITHVSLGHIPKSISPTSSISSAPREFSVYGKKNLEDDESHLGTFIYDDNGDQLQTFKLPADNVGTFTHVTLKPNLTGPDLDKLRAVMLRHCDVNKDGKIQKNELALCLGVKPKP